MKKKSEDWKPDVKVGTIDITLSVNISCLDCEGCLLSSYL